MRRAPLFLVVAALMAGCGSDTEGPDFDLRTPPPYVGAAPIAPTGQQPVEREMSARDAERLKPVIANWAAAVRRGDIATAADFFSLPAIIRQPQADPLQLNSPQVTEAFNASLPCGAKLLGTNPDGRYVVATFVLVDIGTVPCEAKGDLARVGFVFGDKRFPREFTEWWQLESTAAKTVGPAKRPAQVTAATVSDFS